MSNIRNVDALVHVLRCFDDADIVHSDDTVDPVRDLATVTSELVLADLASVEKRLSTRKRKDASAGWNSAAEAATATDLLTRAQELLEEGLPALGLVPDLDATQRDVLRRLQLLTSKPTLFACNVSEDDATTGNDYTKAVTDHVAADSAGAQVLVVCAELEAAMSEMDPDDEQAYREEAELPAGGLTEVVRASTALLGRQSFFTAGVTEARAWDCAVGATAQEAAGVIHTDIARGFIKAQTLSFDEFMEYGGPEAARAAGALRLEGKDYVVQDGDVFDFKFNV